MMNSSRYTSVIFDLDGTLLDTLEELGMVCNIILEQNGLSTHPLPKYSDFVGEGAEVLLRNALGEASSDNALVYKCLDDFLSLYHQTCGQHATLYPGIPELLDELQQAGFDLAVLSNKPHDLTLKNIDIFLKEIPFAMILGQRQGIPKKPDPHGVLEILGHLKTPAEACLYLGDTAIDMKTAIAAHVYPVGVLWGFRTKEELIANGARTLIAKPLDLLDML